jgi:hypothetical protein
MLKEWKRGAKIVLEANPGLRQLRLGLEAQSREANGTTWWSRR